MADTDTNNFTQVRVDIGELKGILTTVVTEHGRRITDGELERKQLRTDLTAVKDDATKEITSVSTRVTTNTENIRDLRDDVKEIWNKMNGSTQRMVLILSPLISVAGVAYQMFGKK